MGRVFPVVRHLRRKDRIVRDRGIVKTHWQGEGGDRSEESENRKGESTGQRKATIINREPGQKRGGNTCSASSSGVGSRENAS